MNNKIPLHERYWLSAVVNKLFGRYQSRNCKLLVDAIAMHDSAASPWVLNNSIESFMRFSTNPVDRFVLSVAVRQRAEQKAISAIICGIATGWTDENETTAGNVAMTRAQLGQAYGAGKGLI